MKYRKNGKSKALSPMIATVLLIAFTVAVGGIISTWLTTLSGTSTGTTGSAVEKATLCARSVMSIKEVSSVAQNKFNITLAYDSGSEKLYGLNVTLIDTSRNSVTVQPNTGKNFNKTISLNPGQMHTISMDITSSDVAATTSLPSNTLLRVTISAMCQDTYPVQGECKSGQACMK